MKESSIFVTSTYSFSGKTAICLGLALKALESGIRIGYIKPIGQATYREPSGETFDEDAILMKKALKLDAPLDVITPILLDFNYLEERKKTKPNFALEKIEEAYDKISKEKDFIIIEGLYTASSGAFMGIPAPKIASKLNSRMLLVGVPESDSIVDDILRDKNYVSSWNVGFSGVIFNNVRPHMVSRISGVIKPTLEDFDIATLGIIPEYLELTAPTVREIFDVLGGEILVGEEHTDKLVNNLLVAAMDMDHALKHFRKSVNKAVITGGDRTDIALAALETNTSVLILTGNIHPNVNVLSRAKESKVPLILVPHDTYTTIRLIEKISGKIRPDDDKRISATKKIVEENVEWRRILKT